MLFLNLKYVFSVSFLNFKLLKGIIHGKLEEVMAKEAHLDQHVKMMLSIIVLTMANVKGVIATQQTTIVHGQLVLTASNKF